MVHGLSRACSWQPVNLFLIPCHFVSYQLRTLKRSGSALSITLPSFLSAVSIVRTRLALRKNLPAFITPRAGTAKASPSRFNHVFNISKRSFARHLQFDPSFWFRMWITSSILFLPNTCCSANAYRRRVINNECLPAMVLEKDGGSCLSKTKQ